MLWFAINVGGLQPLLMGLSMYLAFATPLITFGIVLCTIYKKSINHEQVSLNNFPNLGERASSVAWFCLIPLGVFLFSDESKGFSGVGAGILIIAIGFASFLIAMFTAFLGYLFLRWKNKNRF